MRAILFLICVLGCCSCASVFHQEYKAGKLNLHLLAASFVWGVCATGALLLWND